jgi:hypothetical protein
MLFLTRNTPTLFTLRFMALRTAEEFAALSTSQEATCTEALQHNRHPHAIFSVVECAVSKAQRLLGQGTVSGVAQTSVNDCDLWPPPNGIGTVMKLGRESSSAR